MALQPVRRSCRIHRRFFVGIVSAILILHSVYGSAQMGQSGAGRSSSAQQSTTGSPGTNPYPSPYGYIYPQNASPNTSGTGMLRSSGPGQQQGSQTILGSKKDVLRQ